METCTLGSRSRIAIWDEQSGGYWAYCDYKAVVFAQFSRLSLLPIRSITYNVYVPYRGVSTTTPATPFEPLSLNI